MTRHHSASLYECVSSLLELQKVMGKRTMAIGDLVSGVKKAGYQSSSSNFKGIVAQTLSHNPKVFKRVGRGEYRVK